MSKTSFNVFFKMVSINHIDKLVQEEFISCLKSICPEGAYKQEYDCIAYAISSNDVTCAIDKFYADVLMNQTLERASRSFVELWWMKNISELKSTQKQNINALLIYIKSVLIKHLEGLHPLKVPNSVRDELQGVRFDYQGSAELSGVLAYFDRPRIRNSQDAFLQCLLKICPKGEYQPEYDYITLDGEVTEEVILAMNKFFHNVLSQTPESASKGLVILLNYKYTSAEIEGPTRYQKERVDYLLGLLKERLQGQIEGGDSFEKARGNLRDAMILCPPEEVERFRDIFSLVKAPEEAAKVMLCCHLQPSGKVITLNRVSMNEKILGLAKMFPEGQRDYILILNSFIARNPEVSISDVWDHIAGNNFCFFKKS